MDNRQVILDAGYRLLLAGLIMLVPLVAVAAWEDYKEKTFQDTIDENIESAASVHQAFTPGLPQLTSAIYTGEKRSISEDREKMVRAWLEIIGQPAEAGDLFLTEMKFLENGNEHWLPIQKPLITYFEREMKPGETVWLYAVWIGATKSAWLFVVNEFSKSIP